METENVAENETAESVVVETRFGDIEFSWDKGIYMPVGLLGFPEHHVFGLANIPNSSLDQFKLYQSLTDANLSFIVAPYNMESAVYAAKDLDLAQKSLAISSEDMAILMVVTIRSGQGGQGITMSTNLRAPILVDTNRQVAWQHILPNDKYSVQHDL
ncbi:flagellar assembly protein FliW [Thalassospira australica]|uniref:flagellar assembly protein FliW n=1 Tax=Thalassospira australica TaxID=1528106 RepID=UPI00051A0B42|nr:flagellar assembly protein FliW [Thalassospira australica]